MIRKIRGIIQELIGRVSYYSTSLIRRVYIRSTKDLTKVNYQFYDKLRRGMAEGLEVAGLLIRPILSKIAGWSLGRAPMWKLDNPESQERFNEWWKENHYQILSSYEDALGLGDLYLVINPDLTITKITPDVVEPIVDENDYGLVIGWRIIQRLQHPTEIGKWMTEINEYYPDRRVRWIEKNNAMMGQPETFRNLIGVLPVIHVANNPQGNQLFGVPELEALTAGKNGALYRYDDLFDAAHNGNLMNGRATPVIRFNDLAALDDFWERYAVKKTNEETGETWYEIPFDSDKLMTIVGDFKYESPGSSAGDAKTLLEILYWLMIEHAEIPDLIMGTEMGQSRASGGEQVEALVRFIEKKQMQISEWMVQAADVAARFLALVERGFHYSPPKPFFESLISEDKTLKKDVVAWAYAEGLIDRATALRLAPTLDIEDIEDTLRKADEEREARNPARREVDFDRALEEAAARANSQEDQPEEAAA